MMKKNYYIFGLLLLAVFNLQAQFYDNMEVCQIDGEPQPNSHWTDTGCGGGPGCALVCSNNQSETGLWSGLIPGDGTTVSVLDFNNIVFGVRAVIFWAYIPSGKEAKMSIQGEVPIGTGASVVGDVLFNLNLASPGVGKITDTALGEVSFNFPHDQWFRIVMNWDIYLGIGASSWFLYIDEQEVIPEGTPFTNFAGDYPTSLGGILFSSASVNNEMYLDNVYYTDNIFGDFPPDPAPFLDDMEYNTGDPLGDWWNNVQITTDQANSGTHSGVIPNDIETEVVLNLRDISQGIWDVNFYMYVPANKEAFFIINGKLPIGLGLHTIGSFIFNQDNTNPGVGVIDDTYIGEVTFNFPHDQWFPVNMNFDFTQGFGNSTWSISIDNNEVFPEGTPFSNGASFFNNLGGINFFLISANNLYYVDDFNIIEHELGVTDFSEINFKISPNPSDEKINIITDETVKNVLIYNPFGSKVLQSAFSEVIDISSLSKGIYFVMVETESGKSIQKFIKK